ncbi:agmatine deiminase family protein [Nitrospirillum viridazoti]|uniref:Putative agmatine deiminase n=1 Tax=Nitrospirillum amazonense TaxID=28077 RepID=A0A560IWV1_9PROT|nr:agmatine deiminase family protein [Nitrospirillum amazonense]TWB63277.1 agmatine deiminase [Nitrospirillum amazonense]
MTYTPGSPAAAGFVMPGEWHPHDRCWMAWPNRAETFPNGLDAARQAYAAVAKAIAQFEPVTIVAPPGEVADASILCSGAPVSVIPVPLSDSWIRDNGPSFVIDGKGGIGGVDWDFNAWGRNYDDFGADTQVAAEILKGLDVPRFKAPLVMEGGSFHVDGEGTLITTEECLLNPNRNPGLTRGEIEGHLRDFLGVRQIIWLGRGYEQDETDGHIDEIACFIRPGLVLAMTTDDPDDPNFDTFQDNIERLSMATDAQGRELDIVTLRTPARQEQAGVRLTLSYTNFYLANGGVVLPAFEDPMDAEAAKLFSRLYPDRQIAQVPALDIVRGGGGIHCITQQQPKP